MVVQYAFSVNSEVLKRACAVAALSISLVACESGGGSSSAAPEQQVDAPAAAPTQTPDTTPTTPQSISNVVYAQGAVEGGSIDLLADVYQPSEACTAPRPYIVMIHGGAFVAGNKGGTWGRHGEAVAARGMVGISINYRLAGDAPVAGNSFQSLDDAVNDVFINDAAQAGVTIGNEEQARIDTITAAVEDAIAAISWARANSEALCIDPDTYALWGSSAGAFVALITAYAADDYALTVPKPEVVGSYWSRLIFDDVMVFNDPPLFIIHGTDDTTTPYQNALNLQAQAESVSIPYSFYTVNGAGHSFSEIPVDELTLDGDTLLDRTIDFLEAHLTGGTPVYEVRELDAP